MGDDTTICFALAQGQLHRGDLCMNTQGTALSHTTKKMQVLQS